MASEAKPSARYSIGLIFNFFNFYEKDEKNFSPKQADGFASLAMTTLFEFLTCRSSGGSY